MKLDPVGWNGILDKSRALLQPEEDIIENNSLIQKTSTETSACNSS